MAGRMSPPSATQVPGADRRVDDRRRAAIDRMMRRLVHDMLAALRSGGVAFPNGDDAATVDRVARHLASTDRDLERRLGTRADLHVAAERLRLHDEQRRAPGGDAPGASVLERLARTPALAAAVAAYRERESARLDGFCDPVLPLEDLDAAAAARLGWTIAAAVDARTGESAGEDDVFARVAALLEQWETSDAAAALARQAAAQGHDRAALAIALIEEGWPALAAAALGDMVALAGDVVLRLLLDGEAAPIAAIARLAFPADRAGAGSLLLAIARACRGDEDEAANVAATLIDMYDATDLAGAARTVAAHRAPAAYREAAASFLRAPR